MAISKVRSASREEVAIKVISLETRNTTKQEYNELTRKWDKQTEAKLINGLVGSAFINVYQVPGEEGLYEKQMEELKNFCMFNSLFLV